MENYIVPFKSLWLVNRTFIQQAQIKLSDFKTFIMISAVN